jgi:phosphatidylglycerophosphate synthase
VSESSRPARPTIAQVKAITQPEAIRGRAASEHWLNDVYLRKLSPYQTRLLLRTSITANGVTWLMIASGKLAALSLLIPGPVGATLAFFFGQYQMLLDCSDGEIARWRQTSSPAGVFLDKVGHYTAESLIPVALGIRVAGGLGSVLDLKFVVIGLVIALLVILNKALNDMVHVARAFNGLPRLGEGDAVNRPKGAGLSSLRSLVRFFPFHRIFHSVEMTMAAFVAALFDLVAGELVATRILLYVLLASIIVTLPGHLLAILKSSRLR